LKGINFNTEFMTLNRSLVFFIIIFQFTTIEKVTAQFTDFVFTGTGNFEDEARWTPYAPGYSIAYDNNTYFNGICTVSNNLFSYGAYTINSGAVLIQDDSCTEISSVFGGITVEGKVILKLKNGWFRCIIGQTTVNGDISGVGSIMNDNVPILGTGSFSPGYPASEQGILWFRRKFDLRNKHLNIQLFGNQNNDALHLQGVESDLYLGGTLHVTLEDNYIPAIGHQFVIINSAAIIDDTPTENTVSFAGKSFAALDLPSLPNDRQWTIDYSDTGVVLSVESSELPVQLISFSGYRTDDHNVIKWETVSEMMNDHFELERSDTGKNFEVIDHIPGAGSTNAIKSYMVRDYAAQNEIYYYRLKQVDYDGSVNYSRIIVVSSSMKPDELILYPNPVLEYLYLDVPELSFQYTIINVNGKTVQSGLAQKKEVIATTELQPGVYFLKANGKTIRFVKN
jgi:hypothetical protein